MRIKIATLEGLPLRGFAAASAALLDSASADQLVREVLAAYMKGALKVGINPDAIREIFLKLTIVGYAAERAFQLLLGAQPETAAEDAVKKNYLDLGSRIWKWARTYRGWAEVGHRDDGSAYDWSRWVQNGRELGAAASYYAGVAFDSSVTVNQARAAVATASQVTNPFAWPPWLKVGVGVVVFAALWPIVAPVVGLARRRA